MSDLMDLLPEYYRDSVEVVELQRAFEHWSDALDAARDDLLAQLNVDTATWGLRQWEASLGITTDVSKSYPFRRTRVLSRLRGFGTTTTAMIARSTTDGVGLATTVTEKPESYCFDVSYPMTVGKVIDVAALIGIVEELKPAHLSYTCTGQCSGALAAYVGIAERLGKGLSATTDAPGLDYTIYADENGAELYDECGLLLIAE